MLRNGIKIFLAAAVYLLLVTSSYVAVAGDRRLLTIRFSKFEFVSRFIKSVCCRVFLFLKTWFAFICYNEKPLSYSLLIV